MLREKILGSINLESVNCGFYIKNLNTHEVYVYNEKQVVSSASLIKVPIMAEVLRQVKEGELSLKQRIVVEENDKVPYSIVSLLEAGNSYSLKDMITLMIIQSDNTATNMLIDLAGIENVNRLLENIGLDDTALQRKMMDFVSRKEGKDNLTTAADMGRIFELIYKGFLIDDKFSNLMKDILKNQLYNEMTGLYMPKKVEIAHKTGDLGGTNHDCGIVYLDNCDYIFSILTWGAESNNISKRTVSEILRVIYEEFSGEKTYSPVF
jgi:beta-lactamase class A